jgi:hypothetical protein
MARTSRVSRGVAALTLVPLLSFAAACGSDESAPSPHGLSPGEPRVPITERAIAAIMLDHLPGDTTDRAGQYITTTSPHGQIGAELRYNGGPGEDGDLVRATVTPGDPGVDCLPRWCAELETDVVGAVMQLRWDIGVPEEEPGAVGVMLQRAGEYTYVRQSGPMISGDPRELDLPVSIEEMVAVAEDAWLRLDTSTEAVRAGDALKGWNGH